MKENLSQISAYKKVCSTVFLSLDCYMHLVFKSIKSTYNRFNFELTETMKFEEFWQDKWTLTEVFQLYLPVSIALAELVNGIKIVDFLIFISEFCRLLFCR